MTTNKLNNILLQNFLQQHLQTTIFFILISFSSFYFFNIAVGTSSFLVSFSRITFFMLKRIQWRTGCIISSEGDFSSILENKFLMLWKLWDGNFLYWRLAEIKILLEWRMDEIIQYSIKLEIPHYSSFHQKTGKFTKHSIKKFHSKNPQ